MNQMGFKGLEIAPTKILPRDPYDNIPQIQEWAKRLHDQYQFAISSMQSIWFGRTERIFRNAQDRQALIDYTQKAIDFAAAIQCRNLVFGNPKNRSLQSSGDYGTAIEFFKTIGDYAASKGTAIGMEANPPIYNTNFINTTQSALELISKVDSNGFRLNLDVGAMIANKESVDVLKDSVNMINHVHISEPFLNPIEKRSLHKELALLLKENGYNGFVSIEMKNAHDLNRTKRIMLYIKETFA